VAPVPAGDVVAAAPDKVTLPRGRAVEPGKGKAGSRVKARVPAKVLVKAVELETRDDPTGSS
jgi:hypothetical protein